MPDNKIISKKRTFIAILVAIVAIGISWHFLNSTPVGCFNKIFAVGSSLCHQIPSHSFLVNGRQFPVCARCTGLYLGSLIGLIYAFSQGRKAGIPQKGYLILLSFFFVIWGADGVNSGVSEFLNRPFLYTTTNTIRLATGLGMGLLMATALSTLFNITMWVTNEDTPILHSPLQVITYFAICGIASLPFFMQNSILFTINAYLVIASAIIVISLLYTIFWVILLKKENHFSSWINIWVFLAGGFTSAIVQIMLLNALRGSVL